MGRWARGGRGVLVSTPRAGARADAGMGMGRRGAEVGEQNYRIGTGNCGTGRGSDRRRQRGLVYEGSIGKDSSSSRRPRRGGVFPGDW